MFGVISFFVVQVFLFGFTRAQCGIPCSACKEINPPADMKYVGNWTLLNPTSPRCEWNGLSCLYRRDEDGEEMCFCDPGPIIYEENKCIPWGVCYNYTAVDNWYPVALTNNDVPTCDTYCLNQDPSYTYFILSSTNVDNGTLCGCGWGRPDTSLEVDSSYCWINCPGNNNQICGGFNNFNNDRYVNIWPTFPNAVATDGSCYNSTAPIYTEVINLNNNDVQACNTYNQGQGNGFTYFALGSSITNNGKECYTGYSAPPADQLVKPYYCWGSPCPGNNDQECGYYQNWNNQRYINVWKRIN